ncbi:MAG: polymerase, sigma 32 subunit, RpoH [Myxococcales bacterium]|nr:polymerase, sigma 32 subunit, RpoH [Myxococcales bacterium]
MRQSLVQDASFARYVRAVSRRGRLDAETEERLVRRWQATHDPAAARALVETQLLFVVAVARGFAGYGIPIAELVAEGNVGLVEALGRFDPSRKVRFLSYAVWWIRARILAYVRDHRSVVRPPTRWKTSLAERDVSLDAPSSIDDPTPAVDRLADDSETPDREAARVERERIVRTTLARIEPTLSEREWYVVHHRLIADEPETLASIARRFRISRERTRQVQEAVRRKLRDAFADLAPEQRAA